ncbi:unnamed protein product [Trichobilharzia szidati]|nr:unnamed protein product [Trichobilharzia szidati]
MNFSIELITLILLKLLTIYGLSILQEMNKVYAPFSDNITSTATISQIGHGLPTADKTNLCSPDSPITYTSVGIYCGIREIVHWPNGPASMVDIYHGNCFCFFCFLKIFFDFILN